MLNPRADGDEVELKKKGFIERGEEAGMRLPGKERSRRTGARDPDNCRQRKTELSRGQKTTIDERARAR